MRWNDLTMSQRSDLMKLYLKHGITSLDSMREHYDSFATGDHLYQDGESDDGETFVPSQASEIGWMPEVEIVSEKPAWQRGLTDYDWARARQYYSNADGYLTTQGIEFLKNISSKRTTGQSNYMRDVNKLSYIPNAAVGAIGAVPAAAGLIAATTNPVVDALLTAHGVISAPKNIEQGIKNIKEGNTLEGVGDLGFTALDVLGFGQLARTTGRMAKMVGLRNVPKLASINTEYSTRTLFNNKNLDRLQKLRDEHFLLKAGNNAIVEANRPVKMYHSYPTHTPKFNEFLTNPEGYETFIYTHTNPNASHTYVQDDVAFLSIPDNYQATNKKEYEQSLERFFNRVDNNEFTKVLYGKQNNHFTVDANGAFWNKIPVESKSGNTIYLSTRDIESQIMPETSIGGFTIKNLIDNGKEAKDVKYLRHLGFDTRIPISEILSSPRWIGDVRAFRNPEDLKSADAITYDDFGKVIPLWKRDNFMSKDLRYEMGGDLKYVN